MQWSGYRGFLSGFNSKPWPRDMLGAIRGIEGKQRLYLILGFLALLFLIAIIFAPKGTEVEIKPVPPVVFLNGWSLKLVGQSPGQQSAGFERTYRPSQVAFVPAESSFTLTPNPPLAQGIFTTPDSERWKRSGGQLQDSKISGSGMTCVTPNVPGLYSFKWQGAPTRSGITAFSIVVLEQASIKKTKTSYNVSVGKTSIGHYGIPEKTSVKHVREHARFYQPPKFFTHFTEDLINLPVCTDHILGQFVAFSDKRDKNGKKIFTTNRHTSVMPPHVPLFKKVEALRLRLLEKGVKVSTFWITSGFRTPAYNKKIHGATFSRHCYGDAVDICIDENKDHHMDDLNNDGKLNRKDGIIIAKACMELEAEGLVTLGGIGVYEYDGEDSVRSHVHIDCRGFQTQWGQAHVGRKKVSFDWWSSLKKKK